MMNIGFCKPMFCDKSKMRDLICLCFFGIQTFDHLRCSESDRGYNILTRNIIISPVNADCPGVHKGTGTFLQKFCMRKATIGRRL